MIKVYRDGSIRYIKVGGSTAGVETLKGIRLTCEMDPEFKKERKRQFKLAKNKKFEGRNVYIDDVGVYFANWADTLLKRKYPSLPPFLAINGHLYNAYCLVTTQDRERPYKILKELQTDTSIKAIKTRGWSWLWLCVPVLHNFVYTKYIYHELPKSSDMLPFKAKGVANEAVKGAYLTSGQATKEVYEATHGKIRYGFVLQLKRSLNYDTRYFHNIVYGYPAPKSNNKGV